MIYYFDTSAFVPLLIAEPGSSRAKELWGAGDRVSSSQLLYVEASAALAQARRMGRIDQEELTGASTRLDVLHRDLGVISVDEPLTRRAARIAHDLELRAYDAVHCAAAEQLLPDGLVMVSGDARLLRACAKLGMATSDTNDA